MKMKGKGDKPPMALTLTYVVKVNLNDSEKVLGGHCLLKSY